MKSQGWIKLHRSFKDWEWYTCVSTSKLFTHLLLCGSWGDSSYKGKKLPPGTIFTSHIHLHAETGLSVSTVKRCLKKLELTGEIECDSERSIGTKIKIVNFKKFQI